MASVLPSQSVPHGCTGLTCLLRRGVHELVPMQLIGPVSGTACLLASSGLPSQSMRQSSLATSEPGRDGPPQARYIRQSGLPPPRDLPPLSSQYLHPVSIAMFGLTRLSLVSLLAFTALAQDNAATSVMPSPAAGAEQSNGNAMATGSAAMPAQSDGPDGNDVPANSGGNTGWNTTYFHTPSNSKVYGFWVNGIENTALWNPVNITTRLVLTNSNKELWGGEKELQRDSE